MQRTFEQADSRLPQDGLYVKNLTKLRGTSV